MKNTFQLLALAAVMAYVGEGRNLSSIEGILDKIDDEEEYYEDEEEGGRGLSANDDYELNDQDEEWDLREGGRRLMSKKPIDADIWRNPFGETVPYFQASCKLIGDDKWSGNISLFQDLRYADDSGAYKPISVSASIRELENCAYSIGVYDSDPRNSTSGAGA